MRSSSGYIREVRNRTLEIEEEDSLPEAYHYLFMLLNGFEDNAEHDEKEIDECRTLLGKLVLRINNIEGIF